MPLPVKAAQSFVSDIWKAASAALINPARLLPRLALRLLLIDISESCLRLTNQATYYK